MTDAPTSGDVGVLLSPVYRGEIRDSAAMIELAQQARNLCERVSHDDPHLGPYLLSISSILINEGSAQYLEDVISEGKSAAEAVLDNLPNDPPGLHAECLFNAGGAASGLFDARAWAASDGTWSGFRAVHASEAFRNTEQDVLAEARRLYARAARWPDCPSNTAGRALCNLANVLDSSRRWVEAYDCYMAALKADPTNGNASGNAAILLQALLNRGVQRPGHIASLHDHFLSHAQVHQERVKELAGHQVAEKYAAMEAYGVEYHSHNAPEGSDYLAWVVEHRLALTAALEGLGSDAKRWDDSHISAVVTSPGTRTPPSIFKMVNVLKGEYIAARSLAYRSISMLPAEEFDPQPDVDTGTYVDTLDGSTYGLGPQLLILAHRAALDVLDKIAVAINEHFQLGFRPNRIAFKHLSEDRRDVALRSAFLESGGTPETLQPLVELSVDTREGNLHSRTSEIRNAATHRFIVAKTSGEEDLTREALSSVPAEDLIGSTVDALRVGRAGFVYLVDLVDSAEACARADNEYPVVGLTDQP